jgi:hypothetical protein
MLVIKLVKMFERRLINKVEANQKIDSLLSMGEIDAATALLMRAAIDAAAKRMN